MISTETQTKAKWATQTWIGKTYGISAVVVGRILSSVGLKDGPEAASKALLTGHAKRAYTADGRAYYRWDMDSVSEIVEEALVHHGGPQVEKLVRQVRAMLEEAEQHRAAGDEILADLLEDQAYADIPPGMARVVRRRLSR